MLSVTKQQIKELYEEGQKLQALEQDDKALAKYADILDLNANIPEVHFQITRIFLKNDRLDRATTHVKAAATLKPKVVDIWKLWSEVVMTLSDKQELQVFLDALAKAPLEKRVKGDLSTSVAFRGKSRFSIGRLPKARFEAIVNAINVGRFAEAEALAVAELRRFPKIPALYDVLAVSMSSQERYDEALPVSEKGIKMDPGYAEARANYARILVNLGRAPEGIRQCNIALRIAPGMVTALICRSECFKAIKRIDDAVLDLRRAIAINPDADTPPYDLARLLYDERNFFEARDVLLAAKKRGIYPAGYGLLMGLCLAEIGESEEAISEYQKILAKQPNNLLATVRIAEHAQQTGDFDKARSNFKKALKLDPSRGETYRVFLTSQKIPVDDPIVTTLREGFEDVSLAAERRAHFGFALAKVYEDAKEYDKVFKYLHPANKLMREARPSNSESRDRHNQHIEKCLRSVDWSNLELSGSSDYAPIFVTGMPRSGTTLVEQIISSHSTVTSTGELSVITRELIRGMGDGEGRIRLASDVPEAVYRGVAKRYEDYVRRLHPGSDRIVDKSIQTYAWIGPIKRAMPKARFIVVRRDPRDNLLSMYKNVFPENAHTYSYSLTGLAEVYHQFVGWLDMWREMVPDWFYEIQYEDLVSNPEEESRKLIEACGLEWEDACLDFHKSDNRVKTLSLYQVRQPMYKSSTKAWQRYGNELDELLEALGPQYSDAAE